MYNIIVDRSAEKDIEELPGNVVKKVAKVIDTLANNPRPEGVKN